MHRRALSLDNFFLVSKNVRDKRAALITISRQNTFVPQYQKISQGNLSVLCFRKFPVAKKFMDKIEWGGISKIFVETFFASLFRKFP